MADFVAGATRVEGPTKDSARETGDATVDIRSGFYDTAD
jgi:hypothetical protein